MSRKPTMVESYLNEMVNYGGLMVKRGEMIADLRNMAKRTGHPNPEQLVNAYLRGHAVRHG